MEPINKPVVQKNEHKDLTPAEIAAQKAKKAESAKAWKEKKDKEAAARKEAAAKLIKFLADKKVEIPAECSTMLNDIANPSTRRSSGGNNSIFTKLFGDSPKVGDKVSLMDVFKKTFLSKSQMSSYVKQWAEKGIVVDFTVAPNMIDSTYVIKKL